MVHGSGYFDSYAMEELAGSGPFLPQNLDEVWGITLLMQAAEVFCAVHAMARGSISDAKRVDL